MIRFAQSRQGINSLDHSKNPLKRTEEVDTEVGFNRLELLARKLISGRDENGARVFLWHFQVKSGNDKSVGGRK